MLSDLFRSSKKKFWLDDQGQSLVLVVIFMTALMGMLALAADAGYAFAMHGRMQVAADAAALGGARELALGGSSDDALSMAEDLLAANGADVDQSDLAVAQGFRLQATARVTFDTFFARILGIETLTVAAFSEAAFGQLAGTDNLMPLAVEMGLWSPGDSVTLWGENDGQGQTGPGNWGWARWLGDGPNTPTLIANISNPSQSDYLSLGDLVSGSPGVSFTPAVEDALRGWIGQEVMVFLYEADEVSGNGENLTYRVRGFATFVMTDVSRHGNTSQVTGQFVNYTTLGGTAELGSGVGTTTVVMLH